jgi:acetyl-CoA decarbonylase/synthase complex subunit gamma
MKLSAKQVELKDCPHVSEESKSKLDAASAPPVRLIELSGGNGQLKVGNETVLFRHEKTFYHKPGIFLKVKDSDSIEEIKSKVAAAEAYQADYVGIDLSLDGFAISSSNPDSFVATIEATRSLSSKPLILISDSPDTAEAGLNALNGTKPLLHAADSENWEKMGELASKAGVPLVVRGDSIDDIADLTQKLGDIGIEDLVIDPRVNDPLSSLQQLTTIRRLAIKENFRPLGYPVITFPGEAEGGDENLLAAEHISKYGGFIVLEQFDPARLYPLLVLRENIYTDPQKPIQVQPGIYEINSPDGDSPLMVTTNFSITYFSIANEVEGSGWPAWLLVTDAEGMSVLTAWAAGKFDSERIAKSVKTFNIEEKISHKKLILPGHVAILSGELEEELPGWEIMVGPREAVDIASYLKAMWQG